MEKTVSSKRFKKRKLYPIEEYYAVVDPMEINKIRVDIYYPPKTLSQRKEAYKKHKKTILRLKPLFKKVMRYHESIAKEQGFKDYVELILKSDGVEKNKVEHFFKNVDVVIKDLNKNFPIPKNVPSWYWSKFNVPDPLDWVDRNKYLIPDDVYNMAEKMKPGIKKILDRIKIINDVDYLYPHSSAKYEKNTKSVSINIAAGERRIYGLLSFVHELGHAISMLKLADRGLDLNKKRKFWHEKQAYKFKFEFEEKCLPEKTKNASRGEIFGNFLTAFFQYGIYTNSNQDFDKLYAEAINRCYPGKPKQKSNPFYVLENGLIYRPGGAITSSIVQAELLLKHSKNV